MRDDGSDSGATQQGFQETNTSAHEEADEQIAVFTRGANDCRKAIKTLAALTLALKKSGVPVTQHALNVKSRDSGEVTANVMLAYRHLEDASMRLGKAIQAADGGVSVYDKATTVGA